MRNTIKKVICSLLVMVFIVSSANVAFAVEFEYPERQLMYPKRYNASLTNVDGLNAYFDLNEFNDYMVEQLYMVDGTIEKGVIDLSQFSIPGSKTEDMAELIWYNSPELFPINGLAFSVETGVNPSAPNQEYIDALYFSSLYTQEESKKMYTKMVSNAEVLLYGVKNNSSLSDLEKALILHDRLVSFNEYDYENYESGLNNIPDESYNAYGALGLGVSVCMGYALAYDYLLEQVGIKSDYCSSDTLNHAWNIVYIGGKPYHVDTTWDDPGYDVTGRVFHDNFLRSTTGIKNTGHNANDFASSPVDTTYDSYFWQNMTASFEVIGDKLYYFDEADKKIYAANDISNIKNKTSLETIADLSGYKWFGYYSMANTRLGSAYGLLYYTAPNAIYCYNPSTKKTTTVLTPEEVAADVASYGSNFNVNGMNVFGCVISGEYYNDNYYESLSVKKNYYFIITTHQKSSEWVVVTPATTTSEGKKVRKCTKCDVVLETQKIDKIPVHTCQWGEWVITRETWCLREGEKMATCITCGAVKTELIPKNPHVYFYETVLPTCINVGQKLRRCSTCATSMLVEEYPATGHKYELKNAKPATCTTDGYTGDRVCTVCGVTQAGTVIKKGEHNKVLIPRVEPTCTKTGLTAGEKCSVCGVVTVPQQAIPALGHSFATEFTQDKAPTSTEPGSKSRHCIRCDAKTDVTEIPKVITLSTPTATTQVTEKGIILSWNAVEGAESYTIYRREYNANTKKYSGWKVINGACKDTSFVDTTVKISVAYSYAVRAVNGTIKSKYIATKGLRYNVTPTVKVANASNGIKVTWSKAANATGYKVYSSTYNAQTKKWSGWKLRGTAKPTAAYWTDTKAQSGTYYRYTVRAVNGSVNGSYNKNGVSVIRLNQPTTKIANASNGIKVTWSKIAGADSYLVYRTENVNGKWNGWKNITVISNGSTTSWVDTTAENGKNYRYTVKAKNAQTVSTYKASATLLRIAQPSVKFYNVNTGMNVSWSKVENATGYIVYSSTYNAKTKKWSSWQKRITCNNSRTLWTDTNVVSGTYYKYTVRAVSGNSNSSYQNTSGMCHLSEPVFSVVKDKNGVNLSWGKVNGATGYRVYRQAEGSSNWVAIANVKGTNYTDNSLKGSVAFTYTIRACRGNTWSSYNRGGIRVVVDERMEILDLVNVERAKAGLSPLEYYTAGQSAGDIRALEIVKKFDHERPDGTMCFTALKELGISYYSAGENIAWGYLTPEAVMDGWMNSPGHRANILNPSYTHLIVGYDNENKAWVQLFLGDPYTT